MAKHPTIREKRDGRLLDTAKRDVYKARREGRYAKRFGVNPRTQLTKAKTGFPDALSREPNSV